MAPRLKVFVTSDGLTDYVVAVSSRAKALEAWGAHQDLFQTGGARQTDDPELIEAACAAPGEVLRRPTGATPPSIETRKAKPAAFKPARPAKPASPPIPAKPKGPPPAAVKKVKDLEARLTSLAAAHGAELDAIADQRAALDARREKVEAEYFNAREKLREALRKARLALR